MIDCKGGHQSASVIHTFPDNDAHLWLSGNIDYNICVSFAGRCHLWTAVLLSTSTAGTAAATAAATASAAAATASQLTAAVATAAAVLSRPPCPHLSRYWVVSSGSGRFQPASGQFWPLHRRHKRPGTFGGQPGVSAALSSSHRRPGLRQCAHCSGRHFLWAIQVNKEKIF